ncbi:MAG: creatininase family protein [Gemmatimonadota bacterium]|nr:MAG: creatininase family protein [Gemmatimonadota bacterium]
MRSVTLTLGLVTVLASTGFAQHSRHLNELNWMEVEELVPARIQTVFLAVGTVEAHGVGPNGADNLVPEALAEHLAEELDGLIAPTISYGVNTHLDEYAGTFGITAELLEALAKQVFVGLSKNGVSNIIVLNGHGPNFEPLNSAALEVFRETDARILVINWWSATADVVEEVWGEQGGHAGLNENAALMVVAPDAVHPERYRAEQATPYNTDVWRAYPFPTTIGLYAPGEGYLDFDREKAERYFERVKEEMLAIVGDVIAKWEAGGR